MDFFKKLLNFKKPLSDVIDIIEFEKSDDNIEVIPKKKYIAFKAERNFVDILPQKNKIKFWLNLTKGQLKDINSIARDVSSVGHWGNGDYEVSFSKSDELPVLLSLIKQSYEKNK